jgi:hypothetical protein
MTNQGRGTDKRARERPKEGMSQRIKKKIVPRKELVAIDNKNRERQAAREAGRGTKCNRPGG